MKEVCNFTIIPIPDRDDEKNVAWEIFYFFDERSSKLGVIRIVNAYVSFMMRKIAGLTTDQTVKYIQHMAEKVEDGDFKYLVHKDLRHGSFCNLDVEPMEFIEIFSRSPQKLGELLSITRTSVANWNMYVTGLDAWDDEELSMTEMPFFFTRNSISMSSSKYYLAGKYSIPFIGSVDVNTDLLTARISDGHFTHDDRVDPDHRFIFEANEGDDFDNHRISELFKKHEGLQGSHINNILIASYDIETYNPDSRPDPRDPKQTIINIGLGFFHLNETKPFYRCSIISRSLDNDLKNHARLRKVNAGTYVYDDEYESGDPYDSCEYISVANEKAVVETFIDKLLAFRPHIILSFNGYTFDDIAVDTRVQTDVDLQKKMMKVFTPYTIEEVVKGSALYLKPTFMKISVKSDGKMTLSQQTMRSNFVQTIDVMVVFKQDFSKQFSERYKLNYMLQVFGIKNPFRPSDDLQKTGLSIDEMFKHWKNGTGTYDIAHYCCQDAWITGTLILAKAKLLDRIYLAMNTYSSLEDSIYRAVTHRVQTLIDHGAYHYKFVMQNVPGENRSEDVDRSKEYLGGKLFSRNTIIGGAVKCAMPGRNVGITGLDFNSMYPSNIIASNIDRACKVSERVVTNPEKYGLRLVNKIDLNDHYGPQHERYIFKKM